MDSLNDRVATASHTRSATPNPTVSVILPVKDEELNLIRVLPTIPREYELVVVDGGSVDGTVDLVRQMRPDATLLTQPRAGKGNALICGFEAARGDIIVMFDGDGSANAREIDLFVSTLMSGADFAKGTRCAAGGGSDDITVLRGAGNRALTVLANRILGTRYTDLCYGYNAFWRDVLPVLDLPTSGPAGTGMQWGDGFEIETVINCRIASSGLVVREVASRECSRIHGVSNLDAWRDGKRVLKTLLTERRRQRSHGATVQSLQNLDQVRRKALSTLRPHRGTPPTSGLGIVNARMLTQGEST